jgi:hypothetical protein
LILNFFALFYWKFPLKIRKNGRKYVAHFIDPPTVSKRSRQVLFQIFRFLLITEVAQMFWYFFHGKSNVLILAKMGWATFWAFLQQTHPATRLVNLQNRNKTHPDHSCDKNCIFVKNFNSKSLFVRSIFGEILAQSGTDVMIF